MSFKILGLIIGILALSTAVMAASPSYLAKVNVYYNVPNDATFNLAFPVTYATTFNESISSNTTASNWISFNFTSTTDTYAQPRTTGVAGNAQAGSVKPIFLIYNTGTAAELIAINATVPGGFALCANSTCTGSCTGTVAACTSLGAGFVTMATTVNVGSQLNVTLYANATSTGGQSAGDIFIRSAI